MPRAPRLKPLILAALILVTGPSCASGTAGGGVAARPPVSAANEPAPAAETAAHNWILAFDSPRETVTNLYAEKFAAEVERLSGGDMRIEIFADGALGGDTVLVEGCARNTINFVVQNTAPQVSAMPELAVFDLPVAHVDINRVREVLDDPDFMETINGIYRKGGFQLLGYADQTFRVLSCNQRITKISDFRGQVIRTMENSYHMRFWQLLGVTPQPMPFGELHTALQQGYVTGQENPYAVIAANRFYEVQKYVMQTNHLPHIISLMMNLGEYERLEEREREILHRAIDVAKAYAREQADLLELDKIAEIEATGTEIIPLSDAFLAELRERAQPVYDQITERVGAQLVETYLGGAPVPANANDS